MSRGRVAAHVTTVLRGAGEGLGGLEGHMSACAGVRWRITWARPRGSTGCHVTRQPPSREVAISRVGAVRAAKRHHGEIAISGLGDAAATWRPLEARWVDMRVAT